MSGARRWARRQSSSSWRGVPDGKVSRQSVHGVTQDWRRDTETKKVSRIMQTVRCETPPERPVDVESGDPEEATHTRNEEHSANSQSAPISTF